MGHPLSRAETRTLIAGLLAALETDPPEELDVLTRDSLIQKANLWLRIEGDQPVFGHLSLPSFVVGPQVDLRLCGFENHLNTDQLENDPGYALGNLQLGGVSLHLRAYRMEVGKLELQAHHSLTDARKAELEDIWATLAEETRPEVTELPGWEGVYTIFGVPYDD